MVNEMAKSFQSYPQFCNFFNLTGGDCDLPKSFSDESNDQPRSNPNRCEWKLISNEITKNWAWCGYLQCIMVRQSLAGTSSKIKMKVASIVCEYSQNFSHIIQGEVIERPTQAEESCKQENVCVPLPIDRKPGQIIWPKCVSLPRCIGGCCETFSKSS